MPSTVPFRLFSRRPMVPGSMSTSRLCSALVPIVLAGLVMPASAAAQGAYEGDWRTGALRVEVTIGSWGTDCGPRPASTTRGGGSTIHVTQEGDHLRLGSRSTRGCWSDNPAVRRVTNSYTAGVWRIICRTPPDDGRAETATTTLTASGADRIEMRDVTEYDWSLSGSHCTATVTSTRTYDRVAGDATETPPDPPPGPSTDPTPHVDPPPACTAGAPARIALRPADADLEPGERICFSARVVDAAGCAVRGTTPSLSLVSPPGRTGTLRGACFEAAASAAEGEGAFTVVASSGAFRAEAAVRVSTMDLSDLIARPEEGTAPPPADPGTATSDTAAGVAARSEAARGGLPIVPVVLGVVGLVLALIAAIALLRRRSERRKKLERMERHAQERAEAEARAPRPLPTSPPVAAPAPAAPPPPVEVEPRICPTCRRGQPAGVTTCPHDGTALVTYAEFQSKTAAPATITCPACGTQYPSTTRFCGKDGTRFG